MLLCMRTQVFKILKHVVEVNGFEVSVSLFKVQRKGPYICVVFIVLYLNII